MEIYRTFRGKDCVIDFDYKITNGGCDDLPSALDTIEAQQRRIEELEAAISWAYETLMEINVSNYTHDDVCNLNNISVEVILGLAALQPKETK